MRLLDRYLLRELLVPLAYCLSGFVLLNVFFGLFNELNSFQSHKLRPGDIAEYYLVSLPEIIVFVLPIALLLALLYALTNHSRHHEITAIRAAGVSLWRLCLPYFVVGVIASLLLFGLNEWFVPDASDAAEQILNRRTPRPPGSPGPNQVRNLGFVNAGAGRTWEIVLYNKETGEMTGVTVIWKLADDSRRWLQADRALRKNGVWTFYNVVEYKEEPKTNSMPMPSLKTNVLALPQFTETPDEIKSEIRLASSFGAFGKALRQAEFPIKEVLNYLRLHPHPPPAEARRLYSKLHERLAAPWTCLVVVLIAIPFGAASGRRNVFVGVASSILICVIFYVVLHVGVTAGSLGLVPPWLGAWFPNISFAIAGIILTSRVR